MTAAISIEGLAKRFGRVEALAPLELQLPEGADTRVPGAEWRRQDNHHTPASGTSAAKWRPRRKYSAWTRTVK